MPTFFKISLKLAHLQIDMCYTETIREDEHMCRHMLQIFVTQLHFLTHCTLHCTHPHAQHQLSPGIRLRSLKGNIVPRLVTGLRAGQRAGVFVCPLLDLVFIVQRTDFLEQLQAASLTMLTAQNLKQCCTFTESNICFYLAEILSVK